MAINNPAGAFISTTNVPSSIKDPELREYLINLNQNLNSMVSLLNIKDTGQYPTEEFVTGKSYVLLGKEHAIFRKVINFGTLPGTVPIPSPKSVLHGINFDANTVFTSIYGVATDPVGLISIPLPYASTTLNQSVQLSLTSTNVVITTGIDRTAFTKTYICIEYYKF